MAALSIGGGCPGSVLCRIQQLYTLRDVLLTDSHQNKQTSSLTTTTAQPHHHHMIVMIPGGRPATSVAETIPTGLHTNVPHCVPH